MTSIIIFQEDRLQCPVYYGVVPEPMYILLSFESPANPVTTMEGSRNKICWDVTETETGSKYHELEPCYIITIQHITTDHISSHHI